MQGGKLFDISGKRKKYLKAEIDELKLTVRSKISERYRGINDFKKGLPA
jgi:hypothetical protein